MSEFPSRTGSRSATFLPVTNERSRLDSKWALRQAADLTQAQLVDYDTWGFVPEKPPDGWPLQVAERLNCVRKMATPKRLHRRLLVLRGKGCLCGDSAHWFHDIDIAKIRDAIGDTLTVMKRPVRKMKNVHNAWSLSRDPAIRGSVAAIGRAPAIETWPDLISTCELGYLATVFDGILRTIDMVFPRTGIDLSAIPYEEQVSLAALVQLNERRRLVTGR